MSIQEMRAAGIDMPEIIEEEQETSHGKIHVHRQVGSGEGIYDPKTGKIEHSHRNEQ